MLFMQSLFVMHTLFETCVYPTHTFPDATPVGSASQTMPMGHGKSPGLPQEPAGAGVRVTQTFCGTHDALLKQSASALSGLQIFGCISFELFGHYKGTVRNFNRFFVIVVDEAAKAVLPPERV